MRIAIVDGYATGRLLAKELSERGVECIHVRSLPRVPKLYVDSFSSESYVVDLGYEPEPALLAQRLADLAVDRVVAGSECGVILADTLTNLMKLPGNDSTAIAARRDKALMAARVRAAGLGTPAGRAFTTPEEAVSWFVRSGRPEVVAKPTMSLGTDNVHFCTDARQLEDACRRILGAPNLYDQPNVAGIVQERVHGVEYYVNTVSHEGIHRTAEMGRYSKAEGANRSLIYDYDELIDPHSEVGAQLREFVFGVLDALGIRTGAAHSEVMITASGPVLIETGARLGGGATPYLIEKYFGLSQTGLFADALLDPARLLTSTQGGPVSGYSMRRIALINRVPGTVRPVDEWMGMVRGLPTAVESGATVDEGTWLPETADETSSPGYLYLASADYDEVVRDYHTLRENELDGPYTC